MLRETFNDAAELYDRARPGYPPALVAELARLTGLGPDSRVMEVGPGTGQLTRALAGFGCHITAVELGDAMAAVARRRLGGFPRVDVRTAEFERWPLPAEPFDVLACATAFHWLDPAVRVEKAADALRAGGHLAVVVTHHVAGGSADFFARVQECYERWDPATPPGLRLRPSEEIVPDTAEFETCPRFDDVTVIRCERDITYTSDQYIDVLLTYSGHRALDSTRREGLPTCVRDLIQTRHDGRVTKRYLHELIVATRVTP
ncbi:class I SAM-dependent methyltransferase [Streptomyces caeruleatus]